MIAYGATLAIPTRQDAPPLPRDPRWLSVSAVAARMGVDPSTIWRWQTQGQLAGIRVYKPGRFSFYWAPDVDAWVKARGGDVGEEAQGDGEE